MESNIGTFRAEMEKERAEKIARERRWDEEGMGEEFVDKLDRAKTMQGIGSVLFETTHRLGKVCWKDGFNGFQEEEWDRLKPILERWSQYEYVDNSPDGLEIYTSQATLLEEFPGDEVRRKLDRMLRHYTGVEKTEGFV